MQPEHQRAKYVDTRNMSSEDRSRFVQETLVICRLCRKNPVWYVFQGRGAESGVCLTCWESRNESEVDQCLGKPTATVTKGT